MNSLLTIFLYLAVLGRASADHTSRPGLRHRAVGGVAEVSLEKSGNLTGTDGVVIRSRLAHALNSAVYKHRRTMAMYQQRYNKPMEGFEKLDDAVVKKLVAGPPRLSMMKRQVATDPLTDQNNELLWTGPLSLGTPAQTFQIDFDTGSADLWVTGSGCADAACTKKNKYNAGASKTASAKNGTFSIGYGDGSSVKGPIYTDTVRIAGVSAPNQYFSPVTTEAASFGNDPADGIGGMAFPAISNLKQNPFFQNLYANKAVAGNLFAFKLAQKNSALHLGGTVSSAYTGQITYTPVTQAAYWMVNGGYKVNNGFFSNNIKAIIDTGTTIIVTPSFDAFLFWLQVPGSSPCPANVCGASGYYTFPCNSAPKVSFTFGGASYDILPSALSLGPLSTGSTQCVGAIAGQDVGIGAWIMGDTFLRSVYAVFDVGQKRVGFAKQA